MKRRFVGVFHLPVGQLSPAMVVTATAFTLGVLGGSLLARQVDPAGLEEYLSGYLTAAHTGQLETDLLTVVWKCLRLPLLAFLLGLTVLGLVGIPLLVCGQGATLAFAVAAFLRSYGIAGLLPALAVFGVTGLSAIPALLLSAIQGWRASGRLLHQQRQGVWKKQDRRDGKLLGLSGLCVLAHILAEGYGVLPLLTAAVGKM